MNHEDLTESIEVSPIFGALSKQSKLFGVDYDYAFFEFMIAMIGFIATDNLLMGLLIIPLHLLGFILTFKDQHIFKIISVKASIGQPKYQAIWHCKSYGEW